MQPNTWQTKILLRASWVAVALLLSGWLALILLEGDACVDAGGSFKNLTLNCDVADGREYVPLVMRSHWPFWSTYGAVSLVLAAAILVVLSLLAAGLNRYQRGKPS